MATVLVVDDEEDIRHLVKVNLEMDGHQVMLARDGAEALDAVRATPPDVMILDLMMPKVDGWKVLETVKREPNLDIQNIPILMLTAHDSPENRMRGGIEGAIRYLAKPFSAEELRREVKDAIAGEPEPVRRRAVRTETLEQLAREEKGEFDTDRGDQVRTNLGRLERARRDDDPPVVRNARSHLDELTPKQRQLLETLRDTPSVTDAAAELDVSRSNIYASLRRIGRKLGTSSVPELLAIVRTGGLLDEPR